MSHDSIYGPEGNKPLGEDEVEFANNEEDLPGHKVLVNRYRTNPSTDPMPGNRYLSVGDVLAPGDLMDEPDEWRPTGDDSLRRSDIHRVIEADEHEGGDDRLPGGVVILTHLDGSPELIENAELVDAGGLL